MFYAKKLQLAASTLMIAPGMFEQQTDPSNSPWIKLYSLRIYLIHYGLITLISSYEFPIFP